MTTTRTWVLTPQTFREIDDALDQEAIYAKGYWQTVDGQLAVVGLRIGSGPDRLIAHYGDTVIRYPSGRWAVHKQPRTAP